LRFAELGEDSQSLERLRLVDPAHREADMHEHPISDAIFDRAPVNDASDIDLALDAGDVDGRELAACIRDGDDPPGTRRAGSGSAR